MTNKTQMLGTDPLTIRMTGTSEYVKREVDHLDDLIDLVEFERLESIRQDYES